MTTLRVTQKTSLELGFGRVTEALAERALTPCGKDEARRLELLPGEGPVRAALARVGEAVDLLRAGERLPVGGVDDVSGSLLRAEKGAVLAPEELLALARLMRAAAQVRSFLKARREVLPGLSALAEGLVDLSALASRIEYAIDPSGAVRDEASDLLLGFRRRARGLHGEIRGRIDGLLKDDTFKGYLQDSYFSVRNERYVVPVNVQFRAKVPGIVHNASQTGQTIFVEPQELLELGNELAISEALAVEEERRILAELSESAAGHVPELSRALAITAKLDLVMASAQLAVDMDAAPPEPGAETSALDVTALRHPLLVLQGKPVVANDVRLEPSQRALVVSGPNAGGKTVTITALALVALMARAGLWVPAARGAKLPLFSGLASTIGDQQDLSRDLSTFSAHLKSLTEVLAAVGEGWLVVIDEIAADTDPRQGAALARAILDELVGRGARVLVTTHLDEVKALAVTDARYVNASVGLDEKTLMPTYRLELGAAGGSSALAMAARVGLPEAIIEKARRSLEDESLLSTALDKLEHAHAAAEEERRRGEAARVLAETRGKELEAAQKELEVQRREIEARVRRELADELGGRREEVRRLIAELQQVPTMAAAQRAQKRLEELEAEQSKAAARLDAEGSAPGPAPAGPGVVSEGSWVRVLTLGKEGRVLHVEGKHATVEVGALHTRAKLVDLVAVREPQRAREARGGKGKSEPGYAPSGPPAKIDVRGMRADEAMAAIESFLDKAYLEGPSQVAILHGHGTGALKHLIREALEKSPYVERFRPGDRHEGGDGVTLVDLKG